MNNFTDTIGLHPGINQDRLFVTQLPKATRNVTILSSLGYSVKEISELQHRSLKTVKNQLSTAYEKTGSRGAVHLAISAQVTGQMSNMASEVYAADVRKVTAEAIRNLSCEEQKALGMLSAGYNAAEQAAITNHAIHTKRNQLAAVYEKLEVSGQKAAVVGAFVCGWAYLKPNAPDTSVDVICVGFGTNSFFQNDLAERVALVERQIQELSQPFPVR